MKRIRRKRRKNYYFSLIQLRRTIRRFLHRYRRKCFYLLSLIILLSCIYLIYIIPNFISETFGAPKTEEVFNNTETKSNLIEENENTLLTLNNYKTDDNLINTKNIEYKSEDYYKIENHFNTKIDTSKLKDLNYLKNNLYIVDSLTDMTPQMFDMNKLLGKDLTLKDNKDVKVLIFNTHSSEIYKDSKNSKEGVVGLSYELQKVLKEKYGINAMVHEGVYDSVNGQSQILGAYQRMSPDVEKVLAENPSIEVCIDIHRDGLPDDIHLVSNINGKQTAQIMFVNGLSKVLDANGTLIDAQDIPNPNLETNLSFSLALKLKANEMYPSFARKIYLHAYRYSLFMKPKSILVEVGSQTNTFQECKNAMEPLADILADTLLNKK